MFGSFAIQRQSQPGYNVFIGALVRTLLAEWRHLARAKLSDNAFPGIGMPGDIFMAKFLEIQAALLRFAVVATNAVLIDDTSNAGSWIDGGSFGAKGFEIHDQNRQAKEKASPDRMKRESVNGNSRFQGSQKHTRPGLSGQGESRRSAGRRLAG
jgi:hypothetical protein